MINSEQRFEKEAFVQFAPIASALVKVLWAYFAAKAAVDVVGKDIPGFVKSTVKGDARGMLGHGLRGTVNTAFALSGVPQFKALLPFLRGGSAWKGAHLWKNPATRNMVAALNPAGKRIGTKADALGFLAKNKSAISDPVIRQKVAKYSNALAREARMSKGVDDIARHVPGYRFVTDSKFLKSPWTAWPFYAGGGMLADRLAPETPPGQVPQVQQMAYQDAVPSTQQFYPQSNFQAWNQGVQNRKPGYVNPYAQFGQS